MAQSRHETNHGQRKAKLATERGVEALRQHTETVAETGYEDARQAGKISAAAFTESVCTGLTLADATRDAVSAWSRYAEDVMRNTSHAAEALLRSRTFAEMMQVQANLVMTTCNPFSITAQS